MKRIVVLLVAAPLWAQPYWRHNVVVGGGPAFPGGDLKPYFDTTGFVRVSYGFRFHRNFQADAGLDVGFQSAGIRDYYESYYGPLRIRDYQYFLPLGGRVILPLARDKVLLYGGGGGAYLNYSEILSQPFNGYGPRIDCPPCRSRSGWGYYALAGGSVALDYARRFRLGATATSFRATVSGDSFGELPRISTQDRWLNLAAEFTVSF